MHLYVMNGSVLLRAGTQGDEQAVLCWKCISVYICCPEFLKNSESLIMARETIALLRKPSLLIEDLISCPWMEYTVKC